MALETLRGVKEINGVTVSEDFDLGNNDAFILIDHPTNMIAFQIQEGPIKENGINGCQVVDILGTALKIFEGLDEKFPCYENDRTIQCLVEAIHWQEQRTKERLKRGVEGTSKP